MYDTDSADEPKMRIEVHNNYPPRLTGFNDSGEYLEASCRVKVIPSINATVKTSNGALTRVDDGAPTFEQVRDAKTFSGSNSVNLAYQPNGLVEVSAIGSFFTKWGTSISPKFATPGSTVYDVTWVSESSYKDPKPRVVRSDEVVAVDDGNKVVEVFGAIEARYTISYDVYRLVFEQVEAGFAEKGWVVAHLVAFYRTYTTHAAINPPNFREK